MLSDRKRSTNIVGVHRSARSNGQPESPDDLPVLPNPPAPRGVSFPSLRRPRECRFFDSLNDELGDSVAAVDLKASWRSVLMTTTCISPR
jgi:hypothetical protein